MPNAIVRPREALLVGLLTTLAFKLTLALFAGFSQYFVYNVIYGAIEELPVFFGLAVLGLRYRPLWGDFRRLTEQ